MNRDREAGLPGARPRAAQPDTPATVPIHRRGNASTGRAHEPGLVQAEPTQPIPAVAGELTPEQATEQTQVIKPVEGETKKPSLLKASGSMAIATLISRITGFGWKIVLAWVIGLGVENDSFTAANNLPTIITEFLVGGVLTSVIVPVLVRAQKEDADGGRAYTQRLLTLGTVILIGGTVLSVLAAPLLTSLYVSGGSTKASPELATAFAYLLLPQIFFYGASALLTSILQAKQIFTPPAWAPVVNNIVILATIGIYSLIPGRLVLNPVEMTDAHLLTLGIGVTCGVIAQAAALFPALFKSGFQFKWRFGWDSRLSEFGGLAGWMLAYVLVSQVGLMVMSHVGTATNGWAIYSNVWLLLQLPYGVIGFSMITAILPRMSSAAADGDNAKVISDLSLANRMCTVTLLPMSVLMTVLGTQVGIALFAVKDATDDAGRLGFALAVSAFGVLPYAITMMQMRVFYALKDARTPTLIMGIMTVLKIPMTLLCPVLLTGEDVVFGLTFVNSFTFVVGWLVGELWLRNRLGSLGSRALMSTVGKTLTASLAGGLLAWAISIAVDALVAGEAGVGTSWLQVIVGGVAGLLTSFGMMSVFRVAEIQPAIGRLTGLVRRR